MKKLYYSIREVSELVDEEQHILRYWEKEFKQLSPKKNRGGNRIYSLNDLKFVRAIKILLRDRKLPLKKAKVSIAEIIASPNGIDSLVPDEATAHMSSTGNLDSPAMGDNLTKGKQISVSEAYLKEIHAILLEFKKLLDQK